MLLIARRYLLSKKSHSVVNIIAGVSLVSLLLPVGAVIVLLSIFNGFGLMVSELEGASDGDLTVRLHEGRLFEMEAIDTTRLRSVEGLEALSFMSEQTVMLEHAGRSAVVTMRGVDEEFRAVVTVEEFLATGRFEVTLGDLERVVLGNSLATKLGIRSLNDISIDILSLKTGGLQSIIPIERYATSAAKLSGVIYLDQESEERYAYASQRLINKIIGREGVASRLSIKVREGDIERVRREVERVVGGEFRVETRSELNPAMHQIIRYEKMGILLICSFVMLLASFSLIGALTMLIIEKWGDITTLRAMGATLRGVRHIFLMEGLIISGVAIVAGTVLGIGVTLGQQYWGFVELPTSSMIVENYPVELQVWDVVGVVLIAGGISYLLCRGVVWSMLGKRIENI